MTDARLQPLVELVLRMAGGEHSARVEPSCAGDMIDAVTVGINLLAESLELERERRERAEALLGDALLAYDDAPAMFCSVEEDFAIVKCNAALASALGCSKERTLGRRLLGLFPVSQRTDVDNALKAIKAGGVPQRTSFHLVSKDGEMPVLLSGKIADPDSGRLSLLLRDVSLEVELEDRIRRTQKLELMGRLGSGVAHDFNNVLAVLKAGASLLQQTLDRDLISDMLHAIDAGSELTQQLLELSRPPTIEPASRVDLNELVQDSRRLVELSLRGECQLSVELWSEPLPIVAHPSQLSRVLLNLAINARQAMLHGGLLRIRTQGDERRAVLSVEDQGDGMTPEVLDRVGEPFFTTKSDGSGLGIAGCMGIVEHSGGELQFESEAGRGTVVRVVFPLAV